MENTRSKSQDIYGLYFRNRIFFPKQEKRNIPSYHIKNNKLSLLPTIWLHKLKVCGNSYQRRTPILDRASKIAFNPKGINFAVNKFRCLWHLCKASYGNVNLLTMFTYSKRLPINFISFGAAKQNGVCEPLPLTLLCSPEGEQLTLG